MKYENLMDIPWGYEMQVTEEFGDYPAGTKIVRGNIEAGWDDDGSVAFTFPDGAWDYLTKEEIEDIPKENKRMKGSDVVSVELTGYELAALVFMTGKTALDVDNAKPYDKFKDILYVDMSVNPGIKFNQTPLSYTKEIQDYFESALLEPEKPSVIPELTEAQKKAQELKETIAKAQQQLEELEKKL